MTVKKKVVEFVGFQIVTTFAKLFYFAGLTALIPLVPLLFSPHQLVAAKYAFGIALGLILVGFILVYWFSQSKSVAFRALGFMTLTPGLLAVFFSYAGPNRMAAILRAFGEASPYLEKWVETYVPHAWLLAGIYIILGVLLVWLSYQVKK